MCNHIKIRAYIYINVNLNAIRNMTTQRDMLYKYIIYAVNIKLYMIMCLLKLHALLHCIYHQCNRKKNKQQR